jgi:hypothetical protein
MKTDDNASYSAAGNVFSESVTSMDYVREASEIIISRDDTPDKIR